MKRLILILTFFLLLINGIVFGASATVKQNISVQSVDGFSIKGTLEYPRVKGQKEFSTVVLLHSLGYSSSWWESLPKDLLAQGYAVLRIDLRGHGASVYNSKLVRSSWSNMTDSAFAKYPDDVIKVIEKVKSDNTKRVFFKDWAIVGADIGANTAVLTAEKAPVKPKTLILLSPVEEVKGLYIPVQLAHLTGIDILAITGTDDVAGKASVDYLKKFAQAGFVSYTSESRSTGMLMLKNDNSLAKIITTWLGDYL